MGGMPLPAWRVTFSRGSGSINGSSRGRETEEGQQ